MFRGLTAPLVGGAAETGINYYVYRKALTILREDRQWPVQLSIPVSAAASAFALSLVLTPVEAVKCRMQVGNSFKGPVQCFKALAKERKNPFFGIMRGLDGTLMREVIGNPLYFSSYYALRHVLPGSHLSMPGEQLSWRHTLENAGCAIVAGGAAGCIMWGVVLPIDTAKTRIQIARPGERGDVNMLEQLRLLWREGRFRALYSGLRPTLIRAFPANAAQWLTWEIAISTLRIGET